MYNLVVWLSVIIIALIVVFVAYAQVTNEIIKYYQEELKKEYEKGYKRGIEVLSQELNGIVISNNGVEYRKHYGKGE